MAPVVTFLEGLESRIAISPRTRRVGALLLLSLMGWIDYITGPDIASAPKHAENAKETGILFRARGGISDQG